MINVAIDPASLAAVQTIQDETYEDEIEVLQNGPDGRGVPNGQGGFTDDWSTAAIAYGRLRKVGMRPPEHKEMGARVQPVEKFEILLPLGTEIQMLNRLKHVPSGVTYLIKGHDTGRTGALEIIVNVDPMTGV